MRVKTIAGGECASEKVGGGPDAGQNDVAGRVVKEVLKPSQRRPIVDYCRAMYGVSEREDPKKHITQREVPSMHQKGIVPEAADIEIWLAHERNGLSFDKIEERICGKKNSDPFDPAKGRVYGGFQRVKKYLKEGRTDLTGHQAFLKRREKEWKQRYFAPGFFD